MWGLDVIVSVYKTGRGRWHALREGDEKPEAETGVMLTRRRPPETKKKQEEDSLPEGGGSTADTLILTQ